MLVGVGVGYLSTFVVSSLLLGRSVIHRGSQQAQVSVVQAVGHGVNIHIVVIGADGDANLVLAETGYHAVIRDKLLLIVRVR